MHHVKPYAQNARAKADLSKAHPQSRTIQHTAAPLQIFAKRSTPPPPHCLAARPLLSAAQCKPPRRRAAYPSGRRINRQLRVRQRPRKPLFSVSTGFTPHGATAQTLARPPKMGAVNKSCTAARKARLHALALRPPPAGISRHPLPLARQGLARAAVIDI